VNAVYLTVSVHFIAEKTSTMSACVICKSNVIGRQHALEALEYMWSLWTVQVPPQVPVRYCSADKMNESSAAGKVQGTWNESSRERTVQAPGNEWSTEGKVCRVYSFSEQKFPGTNGPRNESSRERIFQGTNSLENECSWYPMWHWYLCPSNFVHLWIRYCDILGGPTKVKPTYIFVCKIWINFEWIDKIQRFLGSTPERWA